MPQYIESGIDALRNAVEAHNLDIQSVGAPDTIKSNQNLYLFQYPRDAENNKSRLNAKGVDYALAMTKRKNFIAPHFLDDKEKNSIVNGAVKLQNKITGISPEGLNYMKNSIIANILAGKYKEARELTRLYSEGQR